MSSLAQPQVQVVTNDLYVTSEAYSYVWDHPRGALSLVPTPESKLYRVTIPPPFFFDGSSVPRVARLVVDRWELGLAPPLVHDAFYQFSGILPYGWVEVLEHNWIPFTHPWSRYDVDRLFGRMMREEGISKWKRRLAFHAVDWRGEGGWGNPSQEVMDAYATFHRSTHV